MSEGTTKMESSHKAGLIKPSEWILLFSATVLLAAAFSAQPPSVQLPGVPVEAKMDIEVDETVPVVIDANATFDVQTEDGDTKVAVAALQPEVVGIAQNNEAENFVKTSAQVPAQ